MTIRTSAEGTLCRRAVQGGAAAAAVLALLTGCANGTAESKPSAAPSSSASAQRSTSPASTASTAAPSSTESSTSSPAPASASPDPLYSTPAPTGSAQGYVPASEKGPAQNVPVPVVPAAAKVESEAGAWAYVEYLYRVLEYSFETGEDYTAVIGSKWVESCNPCLGVRNTVKNLKMNNAWVGNVGYIPQKLEYHRLDGQHSVQVVSSAKLDSYKAYFRNKKGVKKSAESGEQVNHFINLKYSNGEWSVLEWRLIK